MSEGETTGKNNQGIAGRTVPAAQQQPEGNRSPVTELFQRVEPLSKGVAAIAIAVYACGFLIVSLHNSTYGFMATNPFRPRILAAGAWFFFWSALPVLFLKRVKDSNLPWLALAQLSYPYYFGWMVLSRLVSPLFNYSDYSTWPGPFPQHWLWVLATVIFVGFATSAQILSTRVATAIASHSQIPSTRIATAIAIASLLLTLFYLQYFGRALLSAHQFGPGAVTTWLFAVGIVTLVQMTYRRWDDFVFWVLGAVFVFALFYYPRVKASWGGGAPVNVTVYFTKDSRISPNGAVSAQLIEESDAGFYIVGPKETRAIYVPRSAVALVYFSDKVTDSSLLRDIK